MERAHSPVADPDSCYRFLRRSLGWIDVDSNAFQQNSHMAASCICCWIRGSSLVPDAMGNIIFGTIHSLGRNWRTLSRCFPLVVARRVRCCARCRVGYDPPPGKYLFLVADNSHQLNFHLRPCLAYMSAPRSHLHKSLVQSVSWSRVQLLQTVLVQARCSQTHPNGISTMGLKVMPLDFLIWFRDSWLFRESNGLPSFLDCSYMSTYHSLGLFLVLQERATWSVILYRGTLSRI